MSAEYLWYIDGEEVDEPNLLSTSTTFTIKNVGDEAGTSLGFYLKPASSNGPFEFPSTDSPDVNYNEIIRQGDLGFGLTIQQDSTTTRFISGLGDTSITKIPLSLGSGASLDQLEIDEEISITISVVFSYSSPALNLYVDLVLE